MNPIQEDKLWVTLKEWQSVINSINDALWVLDANQIVRHSNKAAEQFFGTQASEMEGLPCWVTVHCTTAPIPDCPVTRAQKSFRRETGEIRRGDRVFEVIADPLLTHGNLSGFVHIVRDVTERKQWEEALLASEAKYWLLHESMMDAFVEVDMNGKIIDHNRVYREMLGYTAEELSHLTYHNLTPARWHAFEAKIVHEQILTTGVSPVYEKEYIRKDGTTFPIELRTFLIRDKNSKPIAMWAIVRDITTRKQIEASRLEYERKIQQLQKLESMTLMAGGVAHDFNNLLTIILGNAGIALEELPPRSPLRSRLEAIEEASHRAAGLCYQMLTYSGKGLFTFSIINLNDLVRNTTATLKASLSPQIQVQLNLADNLTPIRADSMQLRQAIISLLMNAAEAIADNPGQITFTTTTVDCGENDLESPIAQEGLPFGQYVCLAVSDTGSGMTPEVQHRIFEPFFSSKFTGRGLGLPALLGIIRAHRGAVTVESTPGKGSVFRIFLPIAQPH